MNDKIICWSLKIWSTISYEKCHVLHEQPLKSKSKKPKFAQLNFQTKLEAKLEGNWFHFTDLFIEWCPIDITVSFLKWASLMAWWVSWWKFLLKLYLKLYWKWKRQLSIIIVKIVFWFIYVIKAITAAEAFKVSNYCWTLKALSLLSIIIDCHSLLFRALTVPLVNFTHKLKFVVMNLLTSVDHARWINFPC